MAFANSRHDQTAVMRVFRLWAHADCAGAAVAYRRRQVAVTTCGASERPGKREVVAVAVDRRPQAESIRAHAAVEFDEVVADEAADQSTGDHIGCPVRVEPDAR